MPRSLDGLHHWVGGRTVRCDAHWTRPKKAAVEPAIVVVDGEVTVAVGHGRRIRVGQTWLSNNLRRLKAIVVLKIDIDPFEVKVRALHLDTGNVTSIRADRFTTGWRGWSLLMETPYGRKQLPDPRDAGAPAAGRRRRL